MNEIVRPHGCRFRDALAIVDPGACNPSGVANSIVDACREIRAYDRGADTRTDPALRLMTYQLAHLVGLPAIYDHDRYRDDIAHCRQKLDELGLKPFGA